ncbi:MAG: NAD(P)H-dependent glycerol-3-phosphate dehydrogenase [Planctomycetota bacterium]|jgi:glycerol-3-phosphate dehydrogenase (NAD(P)+)
MTRRREVVTVVGDGSWGTALAMVLAGRGVTVHLWSRDAAYAKKMQRTRRNSRFLRGVDLPDGIEITGDAAAAFDGATLVVSAVPTQFLRPTWKSIVDTLPARVPICSVTKGIENRTLERPTQILAEVTGRRGLAVLSGPSHAEEVVRRLPTTVVSASRNRDLAQRVQHLFSTDRFRVYTRRDVVGVEFAAAAKNVVAIAAGICDGLGLGDNGKAALLTRGSVEMARLGRAVGAQASTFHGLAGIGDLIATCTSPHGRNRAVGERLGRGESLDDILSSMKMVAEGVATTRSLVGLTRKLGVDMPIATEVHRVLFRGKAPLKAVTDLMTRAPKRE